MMACSGTFSRIAAAAGCPAWHPEQFAGELSRGGLYIRPGKGRRRVPILPDLSSLCNLALAIGAGEHAYIAERVRALRNLVPFDGTEAHYPQPWNALRPPDAPTDWTVQWAGPWSILDGENLGDGLEKLVDRIARDAEPLIGDFRYGLKIRLVLAEEDGPYATANLVFPAETLLTPHGFMQTFFVPPPDAPRVPRPRGVRRDPVIRFPLIDEIAAIWRESLETTRIFTGGPLRPVRDEAATTLAGAVAADPEAIPEACPKAHAENTQRERELKAAV